MTSAQGRLLALAALIVGLPLAACAERVRRSAPTDPADVEGGSASDASAGGRGAAVLAVASGAGATERQTVDGGAPGRGPQPVPLPKDAAGCEALLASAQADLDAARARTESACAKDDDCATTSFRACLSDCGSRAIAKRSAADYEAARAALTDKCRAWSEAPCMKFTPKATPTCSMYRPSCVNGHCTATDSWPRTP
jgi:hypothetical protein